MIVPPSISLPTRKLVLEFDVLGVSFTKEIEFPNIGQLIDISTEKIFLAKNEYQTLQASSLNDMVIVRFWIDMLATFKVLVPDLVKELNVKSMLQLDVRTMNALLKKVYLRQYMPWYKAWMEAFSQLDQLDDPELDQLLDHEEQLQAEQKAKKDA